MKLKSEKGFTTADVVVAILIIVVFAGIIVTLYQNYVRVSKEVERKAQATNYAVELVEEIKQNSDQYFTEENEFEDRIVVYNNEPIEEDSAYSKTVIVEDYSLTNEEAAPGFVKTATVTVNYKSGENIESVELSTVISKE